MSWNPAHTASIDRAAGVRALDRRRCDARMPAAAMSCGSSSPPPKR